jgi:hypothetical protein
MQRRLDALKKACLDNPIDPETGTFGEPITDYNEQCMILDAMYRDIPASVSESQRLSCFADPAYFVRSLFHHWSNILFVFRQDHQLHKCPVWFVNKYKQCAKHGRDMLDEYDALDQVKELANHFDTCSM